MENKKERVLFLNFLKNYFLNNKDELNKVRIEYQNFLLENDSIEDYEAILSYAGINKNKVSLAKTKQKVQIIEELEILEHFENALDEENYLDPFPENTPTLVNIIQKNMVNKQRMIKIFITGKPGTGKTSYVKFLSHKTNLPIYFLKASRLISSYLGDTHKNIDILKKDIEKISANGIILIDEIDSLLGNRENINNDEYRRMIGSFNMMFDSLQKGITIIGITNESKYIDEAILRRFNIKIEMDEIDPYYFKTIFTSKAKQNQINFDYGIIEKIISFYSKDEKDLFSKTINYSVIDNIIDENLFWGKNIYQNLIKYLFNKTNITAKELSEMDLNYSEIGNILGKDRRTIANNLILEGKK
ncbi:AAA family ATPase [Williamsoniiplasma lucivorax]|uniref:ATPase AAA n=1 Tax=Williamsoniiplasma lucivorax TaxID=209274 RepID=A0A2S5RF60_9MOLU|nr:ATP-binding protein [Williamsoniiplasma lucivorax]PPE05928.1 ATPase AAA [Williamsoniiplasma lucivorax]